MVGEILTITIPLPPRGASPNHARSKWKEKNRDTEQYRQSACLKAKQALRLIGHKAGAPYARRVRVSSEWWMGGKVIRVGRHVISDHLYRPKDQGNAIAALKPAYDGLVDAGLIPDDKDPFLEVGDTKFKSRKECGDRGEVVLMIEVLA